MCSQTHTTDTHNTHTTAANARMQGGTTPSIHLATSQSQSETETPVHTEENEMTTFQTDWCTTFPFEHDRPISAAVAQVLREKRGGVNVKCQNGDVEYSLTQLLARFAFFDTDFLECIGVSDRDEQRTMDASAVDVKLFHFLYESFGGDQQVELHGVEDVRKLLQAIEYLGMETGHANEMKMQLFRHLLWAVCGHVTNKMFLDLYLLSLEADVDTEYKDKNVVTCLRDCLVNVAYLQLPHILSVAAKKESSDESLGALRLLGHMIPANDFDILMSSLGWNNNENVDHLVAGIYRMLESDRWRHFPPEYLKNTSTPLKRNRLMQNLWFTASRYISCKSNRYNVDKTFNSPPSGSYTGQLYYLNMLTRKRLKRSRDVNNNDDQQISEIDCRWKLPCDLNGKGTHVSNVFEVSGARLGTMLRDTGLMDCLYVRLVLHTDTNAVPEHMEFELAVDKNRFSPFRRCEGGAEVTVEAKMLLSSGNVPLDGSRLEIKDPMNIAYNSRIRTRTSRKLNQDMVANSQERMSGFWNICTTLKITCM